LVADFYPLTPQPVRPDQFEVVQFISRDGRDALILAYGGPTPDSSVAVRPRGLDPEATYVVWDPLGRGAACQPGAALLSRGLTISLQNGAASRRIRQR